jgi:hypothetical protein
MKLSELLATKPDELAAKQYNALVDFVELRLVNISNHLRNHRLDEAEQMLENSPAGDGTGTDKHFINFGDSGVTCSYDPGSGTDIQDIIEYLKLLQASMRK